MPVYPGQWEPDLTSGKNSTDVVVVASRNRNVDDMGWLIIQPFKYVVMEKQQPAGTPHNLPENKGYNTASYLQFIIETYDHLPEVMIFLHGHRASWHNIVRPTRVRMMLCCCCCCC